jgi:hypothetical protein
MLSAGIFNKPFQKIKGLLCQVNISIRPFKKIDVPSMTAPWSQHYFSEDMLSQAEQSCWLNYFFF